MQILVRLEAISLKDAVGAFDMHKRVAAHLMESLVPIYLLGLDEFFFRVAYHDIAVETPQLVILEVESGVATYCRLNLEIVVKLFKKQTVRKFPIRTARLVVDKPQLCGDAVARHARVADQRHHVARLHRHHAVAVCRSGHHIAFHLLASRQQRRQQRCQE